MNIAYQPCFSFCMDGFSSRPQHTLSVISSARETRYGRSQQLSTHPFVYLGSSDHVLGISPILDLAWFYALFRATSRFHFYLPASVLGISLWPGFILKI